MYKFAKKVANHEGFTLVELIVVIAILGILAGIAIPVYSGYINKANQAKDETLRGAVNTAFAAAWIATNPEANSMPSSATLIMSDDGKRVVGVSGASLDDDPAAAASNPLNDNFVLFFGDNSNTELAFYEKFVYVNGEGFCGYKDGKTYSNNGATATNSVTVTLNGQEFTMTFAQSDIDSVNASSFMDENLGVATLLNQVDSVTTLASDYLNKDGSSRGNQLITTVLHSDDFLAFAATKMGGTLSGEELGTALAWADAYKAYQADKSSENAAVLAALENQINAWSEEKKAYMNTMRSSLDSSLTNAMVFYAAAQSNTLNNDAFLSELASMDLNGTEIGETVSIDGDMFTLGLKAYESIVQGQGSDSASTALSKAAYGYAMSIAYNNYKSKTGNSAVTWAEYLGSDQGKADFKAYASCMNMINSNATSADFTTALVTSGFNDSGLISSLVTALTGGN